MSSLALSGSAVLGGASAAAIIQSAVAGSGIATVPVLPAATTTTVIAAPTIVEQAPVVAAQTFTAVAPATLPLDQYQLNVDPNPEVIRKKPTEKVQYTQQISLKFLKPPPPEQPGDIVIKQEKDVQALPAPPLLVRQKPPAPLSTQFY